MRLVTLYRVIATLSVLVAYSGVRGEEDDDDDGDGDGDGDGDNDDKTVTVTTPQTQTLTATSLRVEATPTAVPNVPPSPSPSPLTLTPPLPLPLPAIPTQPPGPSTTQQGSPEFNDTNSTLQPAGPPAAAENPEPGGGMMEDPATSSESGVASPRQGGATARTGTPPAAACAQGAGIMMEMNPAAGDLLGGNPPSRSVDLPVTVVFLLLFLLGAFAHISIYRANAKRGHKFLLSDLMFDFCMIRSLTCIFRIIWVFSQLRGVVLLAQIFFNGGAAVVFVVNIFFAQRIVRSMHPIVGWSAPFSLGTTILALSVPPNIVLQITSTSVFFLSTDNPDRADVAVALLKFGSSWDIWLVSFPFLAIFAACSTPGPRPERLGSGSLRVKTSLAMLGAALLATGATVRTYSTFNPRPRDGGDVLYSRAVFYLTQFTFEMVVVALYALARVDLLFHVPDGASGPGDYYSRAAGDAEKAVALLSRAEIRGRIGATGLAHQVLEPAYTSSLAMQAGAGAVLAVFYPSAPDAASPVGTARDMQAGGGLKLPPRPADRVSRRQSVAEALRRPSAAGVPTRRPPQGTFGLPPRPRPPRPPRTTQSMYRTSEDAGDDPKTTQQS